MYKASLTLLLVGLAALAFLFYDAGLLAFLSHSVLAGGGSLWQ